MMHPDHPKREFMEAAIQEALKAKEEGDYAVGSVIANSSEIIASAGERVKLDEDPINHAEILAIRKASKFLGTRHLRGYILYTTHEPCTMCASASVWAMLDGVVSGATIQDMAAYRNKYGNGKWLWRTIDIPASEIFQKGTPSPFHVGEFMREECRKLFHS